MTGGKQSSF